MAPACAAAGTPAALLPGRSEPRRVEVRVPEAGLGTPPCGSPGAEDVRRGPGTCAPSTWARRDSPGAIYWAMAALGASMRAVRQASAGDW